MIRIRHPKKALVGAALSLSLAAPVGGAVAANAPVASEPADRTDLALTVYNRDLALVREVRDLDLPEGACEVEFRGVPERIRPTSLVVRAGGKTGLEILEQNYEFDLMSRESILQKYVGRTIAWIQEDGSRIEGRLLGMAAGPVYEVAGEVVFEVPGRIALPELPGNLRARPTLVWRAETRRGGRAELDVSYLTGGMSWSADYVLDLDPAGERADLQGWVTVENRSGSAYDDATLQLVAGDVNVVTPGRTVSDAVYPMAVKSANMVEQEALYDYHLYTVPWATDLPDNSSKQVSLLDASGVTVSRRYVVLGGAHMFRAPGAPPRQDVSVYYEFINGEDNALGMPLPAGVVRVYGQSAAGKRQLLGEDRIDHTPRDEKMILRVGNAFDLVAERTQTDVRRISDRVVQSAWEVTLRNHKDEDVTIDVLEQVGGDWEILKASREHEKLSAQEILFRVPVPKHGETALTYTVQVTY
jgi:hypothetical protein